MQTNLTVTRNLQITTVVICVYPKQPILKFQRELTVFTKIRNLLRKNCYSPAFVAVVTPRFGPRETVTIRHAHI